MSDFTPTPSQAEGERDDEQDSGRLSPPHPTPSQAEGEREETPPAGEDREADDPRRS
ncbi:hypothetical protein [Streptomyces tagetis]|uniref:Uncharacterized protein n=1 Tax=Streptomyces tagetis TaxID=2820809 RepID=A0A940XKK4_9ACTN|nr:hypothetical protein [Streptomyces sp. RG38]MBQ0830221.1 hypothetical protein [Streptomyces sp. RG38]